MNSKNLGSPEYNRQNQLIDVLLNENLYLKQIISTYLFQGKSITADEFARLQLIAGNNGSDIAREQQLTGNFQTGVSADQLLPGISQTEISRGLPLTGNNERKFPMYRYNLAFLIINIISFFKTLPR